MFTLEAVKAKHGDCLLLHWGEGGEHRVALIDGGPGGTYAVLKKRLQGLAEELEVERVPLELMMLSHIDDDHINGLLALTADIEKGSAPAEILLMWHNSLEGLLEGKLPEPQNSVATASVQGVFGATRHGSGDFAELVLASVPQGQKLHAAAKQLGLNETMNDPYQPLVMAWPGQKPAPIAGGLELEVIAPAREAVENLREAWIEKRDESILAGYDDDSPYNLSSIVVVARFAGKTMLLTGDALGSAVIRGLDEKGLLDADGKAHFDLLKLPHHGSQNNVEPDFFQRITADTYVVSGDKVKFPNPHENAMGWLKEARGDDDYVVYCTYDLPHMHAIFGDRLRVPSADETSIAAAIG